MDQGYYAKWGKRIDTTQSEAAGRGLSQVNQAGMSGGYGEGYRGEGERQEEFKLRSLWQAGSRASQSGSTWQGTEWEEIGQRSGERGPGFKS